MNAEEKMKREPCKYRLIGAGVDSDGWYRYFLRRVGEDERYVKCSRTRFRLLKRDGRILED